LLKHIKITSFQRSKYSNSLLQATHCTNLLIMPLLSYLNNQITKYVETSNQHVRERNGGRFWWRKGKKNVYTHVYSCGILLSFKQSSMHMNWYHKLPKKRIRNASIKMKRQREKGQKGAIYSPHLNLQTSKYLKGDCFGETRSPSMLLPPITFILPSLHQLKNRG
jgi:hypothetical protein